MQHQKQYSSANKLFATLLMFFLAPALAGQPVRAQTFKVLHRFRGPDGAFPTGALVRDSAGNLYSTTSGGGDGGCDGYGCGTVFKMDKTGDEIWLYSFKGENQIWPLAGLVRDVGGKLYGTTVDGGKITKDCGGREAGGCGTVFRVSESARGKTLYRFKGPPDGYFPEALLVRDGSGNLYGTTYVGGADGLGSIFKIDVTGNETILYSFTGGSDGCSPYTGVILDSVGNLYGVTQSGGLDFCDSGYGVVFKLDRSNNLTVLKTFNGEDGAVPDSVLLFDSQGNLYGTTAQGGSSPECGDTGCGTVFELSPNPNGTWTENVLYNFCSLENCTDGEQPGTGPLVMDVAGNIYGTTYFGGTYANCDGDTCGTVFKLRGTGEETVLHSFTGGLDGAFPFAGLVMGPSGTLYGTTQQGGKSCFNGAYRCGVIFEITP